MPTLYMPSVTAHAAALLGLLFIVLSALVVTSRTTGKIMIGSGESAAAGADAAANALLIAVRSHANFAEYVPISLILIGLIEMHSGPTLLVKSLAGGLVLARAMHPVGMRMKAPNPFRAGGFVLSILVLAVASVTALLTATR